MDKHYKSANWANKALYSCMLAGGLIWVADIINVAVLGAKNRKAFNAYKRSHLGVFYEPQTDAVGLSYMVNF